MPSHSIFLLVVAWLTHLTVPSFPILYFCVVLGVCHIFPHFGRTITKRRFRLIVLLGQKASNIGYRAVLLRKSLVHY